MKKIGLVATVVASISLGMAIQAIFVLLPNANELRDFNRGRVNASIWILEGMRPFSVDEINGWIYQSRLTAKDVYRSREGLQKLGIETIE